MANGRCVRQADEENQQRTTIVELDVDYQLYQKNDTSRALASATFSDDFAAEKWARKWAADKGAGEDYLIRRSDGGLSAQLFRAAGGQWYIMRQ